MREVILIAILFVALFLGDCLMSVVSAYLSKDVIDNDRDSRDEPSGDYEE